MSGNSYVHTDIPNEIQYSKRANAVELEYHQSLSIAQIYISLSRENWRESTQFTGEQGCEGLRKRAWIGLVKERSGRSCIWWVWRLSHLLCLHSSCKDRVNPYPYQARITLAAAHLEFLALHASDCHAEHGSSVTWFGSLAQGRQEQCLRLFAMLWLINCS